MGGQGSGNHRTPAKRSYDRMRLAYYLRHEPDMTQADIARELGVSETTICRDAAALQAEWDAEARKDYDALKRRALDEIEEVKAEAWAAWERSMQPAEHKTVKSRGSDGSGSVEKKTIQRVGDPRFLDKVGWCIERQAKMLGLDAPTLVAPVEPDGKTPYKGVVMVEVIRPPKDETEDE